MATVKKIAFYAILIVVFIIFTDCMIKVGLRNTYRTISGKIDVTSPEIIMSEVKTTDVNGYAKGNIKNNSDKDIDRIYIKLDLYSKRDVNLGTEYLEINNLKIGKEQEFEIKYRYSNVNHYEITIIDSKTLLKQELLPIGTENSPSLLAKLKFKNYSQISLQKF